MDQYLQALTYGKSVLVVGDLNCDLLTSFRAVTTFEVHQIILSFPSNRAPGKDKLHMSVIKDASYQLYFQS